MLGGCSLSKKSVKDFFDKLQNRAAFQAALFLFDRSASDAGDHLVYRSTMRSISENFILLVFIRTESPGFVS